MTYSHMIGYIIIGVIIIMSVGVGYLWWKSTQSSPVVTSGQTKTPSGGSGISPSTSTSTPSTSAPGTSTPGTSTPSTSTPSTSAPGLPAGYMYGGSVSDEAGDLDSVLLAWGNLTTAQKIGMGLPAYMLDANYSIAYDPTLKYIGTSPGMTRQTCEYQCSKMPECKSPLYLANMGPACYATL